MVLLNTRLVSDDGCWVRPSEVFRRERERFLLDVGEGTQRQMMRCSTGFDVSTVLLIHLHGDHVLGLPDFLQTLGFNEQLRNRLPDAVSRIRAR